MSRGRTSATTALLLAVAALCLWAASRMTWVGVESVDGLGERRTSTLDGGVWAAATTPLAIALVAAVAAMFAIKGRWAILLGSLVALVAVAAAVPAVSLIVGGTDDVRAGQLAELPARADVVALTVSRVPAFLVLFGALAALIAAVLLMRTPRQRGGLSSRYDAPAVRREQAERSFAAPSADDADDAAEPSERAMWDALDSGLDPTVDPGSQPPKSN